MPGATNERSFLLQNTQVLLDSSENRCFGEAGAILPDSKALFSLGEPSAWLTGGFVPCEAAEDW